jgi:hypothetical protein
MILPIMVEIDIDIPRINDAQDLIARVESVLSSHGLTMKSRGTLKSYPGCAHWHWKYGRLTGTLEVTWWPAQQRLWFKVQSGRKADWIDRLIPQLKADLEAS